MWCNLLLFHLLKTELRKYKPPDICIRHAVGACSATISTVIENSKSRHIQKVSRNIMLQRVSWHCHIHASAAWWWRQDSKAWHLDKVFQLSLKALTLLFQVYIYSRLPISAPWPALLSSLFPLVTSVSRQSGRNAHMFNYELPRPVLHHSPSLPVAYYSNSKLH